MKSKRKHYFHRYQQAIPIQTLRIPTHSSTACCVVKMQPMSSLCLSLPLHPYSFLKFPRFSAGPQRMSSQVHQLALLPAGCQPWNGETVATCGHRFAYCSTQAIYIYEVSGRALKNSTLAFMFSLLNTSQLDCCVWHGDERQAPLRIAANVKFLVCTLVCVWKGGVYTYSWNRIGKR